MSLLGRFVDLISGRRTPAGVHPRDSRSRFADLIASSGANVQLLDARGAHRALIDFYRTVPARGCKSQDDDGDMLLCQWGVYDWGNGESFEFDFVRQFILAEADDDDAISQLHLTLYFEPNEVLRRLGAGDRWCGTLGQLDEFEHAISGSVSFQAVAGTKPERIDLRWEPI